MWNIYKTSFRMVHNFQDITKIKHLIIGHSTIVKKRGPLASQTKIVFSFPITHVEISIPS